MTLVITLKASSVAKPAAPGRSPTAGSCRHLALRGGRTWRALATLSVLLLGGAEARAAEAIAAAAARPPVRMVPFDDRFPKLPDNFADRFPQAAAPTEPPPKRVVTTIERFPRRAGELRASEVRSPSPPATASAPSVRAH